MAEMQKTGLIYKRKVGRIDVEWVRGNSFFMRVVFPFSVTTFSFQGILVDRANKKIAEMIITKDPTTSGAITCTLSAAIINTLPSASFWYLDQIDGTDSTTQLNGSFSLKEKAPL